MDDGAASTPHHVARRYVMMGVCGVGKSAVGERFACAIGATFVEGDDWHPIENRERMAAGIPLTDADRSGWLQLLAEKLADAKRDNDALVLSCSALKRSYRDMLRRGDSDTQFVLLEGDDALIGERLAKRTGHFMPLSLLASQLATLERPAHDEAVWACDVAQPVDVLVTMLVERVASA